MFLHGLQDEFSLVGPPSHLYRYYGIDAPGIATVTERALDGADPAAGPLWTDEDRLAVLEDVGVVPAAAPTAAPAP